MGEIFWAITLICTILVLFWCVIAGIFIMLSTADPRVSVRTGGGNERELPFSLFYWLWEFKTFTVYKKRPFTDSEIDVILGYFDYVSTTSVQFDWFPEDFNQEFTEYKARFQTLKKRR